MDAKVAIPTERIIDWDYDEEADVLYISFGKPRPAVGIDNREWNYSAVR